MSRLKELAAHIGESITLNDEWTIRGFIDVYRNVYPISSDTKIVSKVLELHLFPQFLAFADEYGFDLELAQHQNWYPDMTFVCKNDPGLKFAVDIKTTYRDDDFPGFCNGFTLGSHGEYFKDRRSSKNIQYPYGEYAGHFCFGVIYSRALLEKMEETRTYSVDQLGGIPAPIKHFLFFAEEKWRIASDKSGSGNTANIGSISRIRDIINGNGVFAKAGEELFDDYWVNYGKIEIVKNGESKKLTSFSDYLQYRGLPAELNNPKATKGKKNE